MSSRRVSFAMAIVLAAASIATAGCKASAVIESVWPHASAERSVPKPPAPPRWPLTGLDAPDVASTVTRIVSVKIENSPPARPQSGLDEADVVYETVTEGGITRFNAMFQSHSPTVVGPVRSARLSDLHILPQYHAIFAHCGGDPDVRKELADRKRFDDLDQFFNPIAFWRSTTRSAPHNLMTDINKLRTQGIVARKYEPTLTVPGFTFRKAPPSQGPTATVIAVPFAPGNVASWRYDPSSRRYARSINGKPHADAVSQRQYSAANVVVIWARISTAKITGHGAAFLEIVLTGTGRSSVFRDGRRLDGTWTAGVGSPPVFKAADGSVIKLAPGNTWFQVIANTQDIKIE